ncbi:hypothetical protein AZ34_13225 [Hylemonella gracilis str. Niagara R]|uniref:Uncharacterized protein n=1 Tax=Hylemonella gracilis str. Niagara R TaxID=1458275 RepID=A0A016XLF0_9BURK|nr:hypothetical protein [Hylemonella gracilis]EYC52924.1 hypothetical protein AZ34_13225 [Hylemonella gracilis str. Niagara R]
MKNKASIVLLATISFILSGCGLFRPPVNPEFDKEKFAKGEQSYVVISASNNVSTSNIPVSNIFLFENENGKKFELYVTGTQGVMVPAGNYRLKEYWLAGSKTTGNVTVGVELNFSRYTEASFTAPAGKAIYLGKVETIVTKNKTNAFKRAMNFKINVGDLEYESTVKDDFAEMTPVAKAAFEQTSGLTLEKGVLNWSKTDPRKKR